MAVKERSANSAVAPAIEKSHSSESTVGNLFTFSRAELALIRGATNDYEKKAKTSAKDLTALNVSTLDLDTVRSRCARIVEIAELADEETDVDLNYPLRATLGDALSMHARKLAKIAEKTLPDMLVDTSDVDEAAQRTQWIANKIGEQLTMHLESEADE